MVPQNLKFGGGANSTLLHPLVLAALLVAIPAILFVRRKHLIEPVLLLAFLVPLVQQVVLGGLHIMVLRIIIVAGLVRMLISSPPKWNSLDRLFILWAVCRVSAFLLLFRQTAAFTNQLGFVWDSVGGFLLLRFLIQDDDDIRRAVRALASASVVLACGMLMEHFRNVNLFGYLGGISTLPSVREGSIRAQGPFEHSLLAGTFGATLPPLFIWLWTVRRSRLFAVCGLASSIVITAMSASSTPILTYGAAVLAVLLWPIRKHMRTLRLAAVLGVGALALVMKAPVWFLLARVDLVGGSSGYHRAMLIDQFIKHFSDWWLIGTNDNANWGWDLWDTCNQYVTEGEAGGLAALICFVALLRISFLRLRRARRAEEGRNPQRERYFWCLTATLVAHAVAFTGIVYFDQTRMLWYLMLAVVVASTAPNAHVEPSTITSGKQSLPDFGKVRSRWEREEVVAPWTSHAALMGEPSDCV